MVNDRQALGPDSRSMQFASAERVSQWALMRAFEAGRDQLATVDYVPPPSTTWSAELQKAYALGATLVNATDKTVQGLSGMITLKPPVVDVPSGMEDIRDNATGDGRSMATLIGMVADQVCTTGAVGVLTDYPSVPTGLTVADAERVGARPVVSIYPIETVLEIRTAKVGGRTIMERVRLHELEIVPDGEWGQKFERRVRVLELVEGLYQQRLFIISADGKAVQVPEIIIPRANGQRLTEIPFRLISANGDTLRPPRPPLHELADLNLKHFQNSALHEHCLRNSASPFYFFAGLQAPDNGQPPPMIGASRAVFATDPAADAKIVQAGAEIVGAIVAAMEGKRSDMATIGAQFLQRSQAQIAENTALIQRAGDVASLSTISSAIERGMTDCLRFAARFMGLNEDDCVVTLTREYMPRVMTAQELTAIVAAWQGGGMTLADLYDNLVRGQMITPREGGAADWQDELSQEAPGMNGGTDESAG